MKCISIISFLGLALTTFAGSKLADMDRPKQLNKLAEWREARTEEAMLNLIAFAKNEEIPMSMRAVAALDLNQGYLPVDEMHQWAGKSLLKKEDLVAFVKASSKQDHNRWLEFIQTSVSERKTNKYQLKIYRNEVQLIHGTGLKELNKAKRVTLIQKRLDAAKSGAKIDRVEYETVMDGFLMIAYGFHTDEKGDERIIALLDTERYREDQRIEPVAGVNSVLSLPATLPHDTALQSTKNEGK